jgi:hypothetical protein
MVAKIAVVLFIWWLISQLIAWILKPENDDEAVETWAAVFLAPVAIAYVVVSMMLDKSVKFLVRLSLR